MTTPTVAKKPLTTEEIESLEHSFIGPAWQTNPDGSWLLPERTLGWQILRWCATYLNNFDGTPNLQLTLEQARLILWWYALDEHGEFLYSRGVLQRLKGAGKDPLLAVVALIEFVGPSRFSHWDEDGKPVGVRHPNAWVQIAAVVQGQTKNTASLFPVLVTEELKAIHGIKLQHEISRAHEGRCRLEIITSAHRTLEGNRITFALLNETQHWIKGNHGHQVYETLDGNASKMSSRMMAITNAYLPGEDSVAERMREAWQKIQDGKAADFGFFYDSIEAHPNTPLTPEALRIVVPKIRGDAVWLNVESIIKSVLNTTISPARSRRMYLNQIIADEDALVGPELWKPLEVEGATLRAGDEIVLGFDGGKTDDSTALVALRVADKVAFLLCLEEKPPGEAGEGWQVDTFRVDSAVHDAFRLYTVKAFYADVAEWESHIDDWAEEYRERLAVKASERHAIAWDMRQSLQRITRAHERLLRAIHDVKVFHDGDPDLRRHTLNARRRSNQYGVSFGKESRESPRKVDAYAALLLAHEALHDLRTRKHAKTEKVRSGRGAFY